MRSRAISAKPIPNSRLTRATTGIDPNYYDERRSGVPGAAPLGRSEVPGGVPLDRSAVAWGVGLDRSTGGVRSSVSGLELPSSLFAAVSSTGGGLGGGVGTSISPATNALSGESGSAGGAGGTPSTGVPSSKSISIDES